MPQPKKSKPKYRPTVFDPALFRRQLSGAPVTDLQYRLLVNLCEHTQVDKPIVTVSNERLADLSNCSKRAVIANLGQLEAAGWIRRVGPRVGGNAGAAKWRLRHTDMRMRSDGKGPMWEPRKLDADVYSERASQGCTAVHEGCTESVSRVHAERLKGAPPCTPSSYEVELPADAPAPGLTPPDAALAGSDQVTDEQTDDDGTKLYRDVYNRTLEALGNYEWNAATEIASQAVDWFKREPGALDEIRATAFTQIRWMAAEQTAARRRKAEEIAAREAQEAEEAEYDRKCEFECGLCGPPGTWKGYDPMVLAPDGSPLVLVFPVGRGVSDEEAEAVGLATFRMEIPGVTTYEYAQVRCSHRGDDMRSLIADYERGNAVQVSSLKLLGLVGHRQNGALPAHVPLLAAEEQPAIAEDLPQALSGVERTSEIEGL